MYSSQEWKMCNESIRTISAPDPLSFAKLLFEQIVWSKCCIEMAFWKEKKKSLILSLGTGHKLCHAKIISEMLDWSPSIIFANNLFTVFNYALYYGVQWEDFFCEINLPFRQYEFANEFSDYLVVWTPSNKCYIQTFSCQCVCWSVSSAFRSLV